jgi:hypothetical protein
MLPAPTYVRELIAQQLEWRHYKGKLVAQIVDDRQRSMGGLGGSAGGVLGEIVSRRARRGGLTSAALHDHQHGGLAVRRQHSRQASELAKARGERSVRRQPPPRPPRPQRRARSEPPRMAAVGDSAEENHRSRLTKADVHGRLTKAATGGAALRRAFGGAAAVGTLAGHAAEPGASAPAPDGSGARRQMMSAADKYRRWLAVKESAVRCGAQLRVSTAGLRRAGRSTLYAVYLD